MFWPLKEESADGQENRTFLLLFVLVSERQASGSCVHVGAFPATLEPRAGAAQVYKFKA